MEKWRDYKKRKTDQTKFRKNIQKAFISKYIFKLHILNMYTLPWDFPVYFISLDVSFEKL